MKKTAKKPSASRPRRPPPVHQGALEDALERLSFRDVTSKRMFGALCYYVDEKPFAFLFGDDLALKLPAMELRAGCAQGDGRIFNPGGGDFRMREYLALNAQALMDEAQIDAYVLASYRFIVGQGGGEGGGLGYDELRRGRDELYKRKT